MAAERKLRKSRKKGVTQAIVFSFLSIYPLSSGAATNALLTSCQSSRAFAGARKHLFVSMGSVVGTGVSWAPWKGEQCWFLIQVRSSPGSVMSGAGWCQARCGDMGRSGVGGGSTHHCTEPNGEKERDKQGRNKEIARGVEPKCNSSVSERSRWMGREWL